MAHGGVRLYRVTGHYGGVFSIGIIACNESEAVKEAELRAAEFAYDNAEFEIDDIDWEESEDGEES